MTLLKGWASADEATLTGVPQAALAPDGIVHLAGSLSGGGSDTAFVLPAAMRPSHNLWEYVDADPADATCVEVTTTGDVDPCDSGHFISLAGLTFPAALSTLHFARPSLVHGWHGAGYGTQPPQAALDASGIVHLSGAMAGTSGSSLTLPTQYRPEYELYIPTYTFDNNYGWVDISPSGAVQAFGSEAPVFTSLEGITFPSASSVLPFHALPVVNGWQSGWVHFGTGNPLYAIDAQGVVHLSGSTFDSQVHHVVATLPLGFRPSHYVNKIIYTANGSEGVLQVAPDGQVQALGTFSAQFSSLEGVSYPAGV